MRRRIWPEAFQLTIETPNDIATSVINNVFYELPIEEVATHRERVQAITPDDIQRVARSIRPDRLSMVLVGNAKAFVSQPPRGRLHGVRRHRARRPGFMSATL